MLKLRGQIEFFKTHQLIKDIGNIEREFETLLISIEDNKLGKGVSFNIKQFIQKRRENNYVAQMRIVAGIIDAVDLLFTKKNVTPEQENEIK